MAKLLPKRGFADALKELEKRAAEGDPRARVQLARVRELFAKLLSDIVAREVAERAVAAAAVAQAAPQDEISGLADAPDDVDLADEIARLTPTADQLAQKLALRQQRVDNLQGLGQFARTNPPSILNSRLGNMVFAGNAAIEAARWTGDPAETRDIAVVVAPTNLLPGITSALRPFALITYGTLTMSQTVEVDVGAGRHLNVYGSQCTVQVGWDPPAGTNLPSPDAQAQINALVSLPQMKAMISFGFVSKQIPLTRTRYIDGIAINGSAFIRNIPAMSENLLVLRDPIASSFRLLFFDSAGNQLYTQDVAAASQMSVPIPLSCDVASVTVKDTSGAGQNFVRAIFGLSL